MKQVWAFVIAVVLGAVACWGQRPYPLVRASSDVDFLRLQSIPLASDVGEIRQVKLVDLDADQNLDMLMATSLGLWVRWGGTGLEGWGEPKKLTSPGLDEVVAFHLEAPTQENLTKCWIVAEGGLQALRLQISRAPTEILATVDLHSEEQTAWGAGAFWHGPNRQGHIVRWDAESGNEVVVAQNFVPGDVQGLRVLAPGNVGEWGLAVTSLASGIGLVHAESLQVNWLPESQGCLEWAFCHPKGTPPSIMGILERDGHNKFWSLGDAGRWKQDAEWLMETLAPLKLPKGTRFFSFQLNSGARALVTYNLTTHSITAFVWNHKGWLGAGDIGTASSLHSLDFVDVSGDGQEDFVMYSGDAQAVWVVQWHGPGVAGPSLSMGDWQLGPIEWLGSSDDKSTMWNRPIWDCLPKSHRMHLEEALAGNLPAISKLFHHSGRLIAVHDMGHLELVASPDLSTLSLGKDNAQAMSERSDRGGWVSDLGQIGVGFPYFRLKPPGVDVNNQQAKVNLHEWSHAVYTRDKNLRLRAYVNGQLVASSAGTDLMYDHRELLLGAGFGRNWGRHFHGAIDEVEIASKVLTADEVQARFVARKAMPDRWTHSLATFNDTSSSPMEEVRQIPFRTDGDWRFVEGTSGSAVAFDGQTAHLRCGVDIPEFEVSFSFWFKPELPKKKGDHSVMLSSYGMYNANIGVVDCAVGTPSFEPFEAFAVQAVDAPEAGTMHWVGAERIWLAHSGNVHQWSQGQWLPMPCSGERPNGTASAQGSLSWLEDGLVFFLAKGSRELYALDLAKRRWSRSMRLPRAVAQSTIAMAVPAGRLFMDDVAGRFFWSPKDDREFWMAEPEMELQVEEDEWVGLSMSLGAIRAVSRSGASSPLTLMEAPSWRQALADHWVWAGMAFAGVFFFGWLAVRGRRRLSAPQLLQMEEMAEIDSELAVTLNQLRKRNGDILDSLALDALLGLDQIESEETRRSQRAQWIRDINEWSTESKGTLAIERTKDPLDRRRVLYVIQV